jgi:hypothetical protein
MYEVKCSAAANYASIWNRPPAPYSKEPNPDNFIVATCDYTHVAVGPHRGENLENCSRVFVANIFLVDYRFQEKNTVNVHAMDMMIAKKLLQWQADCASESYG